jgi:signal transduction histidine kinase
MTTTHHDPHSETRYLRLVALGLGLGIISLLTLMFLVINTAQRQTRETVLREIRLQKDDRTLANAREIENSLRIVEGGMRNIVAFFAWDEQRDNPISVLSNNSRQRADLWTAVIYYDRRDNPVFFYPPSYGQFSNWTLPPQIETILPKGPNAILLPSGPHWLMLMSVYRNGQTYDGYIVVAIRADNVFESVLRNFERTADSNAWWIPAQELPIPLSPQEALIRPFIEAAIADGQNGFLMLEGRRSFYASFATIQAGATQWYLVFRTLEDPLISAVDQGLSTTYVLLGLAAAVIFVGGLLMLASLWRLQQINVRQLAYNNAVISTRASQLEKSTLISRALTSTLAIGTLYGRVIANLREAFGFYHVALYVLSPEKDALLLRSEEGITNESGANVFPAHIVLSEPSVNAKAVQTRRVVRIDDLATNHERIVVPLATKAGAELVVPLVVENHVLGTLNILSDRPYAFAQEEELLLMGLANQIAIAMRNAELYESSLEAKMEAETSNLLKSRFLANMSHELRTPLNSIIGYTELTLKGIYGPLNAQQLNRLEKVHRNGQSLLALLNEILDLSKIEAGKMELNIDWCDPLETARDVAATIMPLVEQNGNRFEIIHDDNMPALYLDKTRLRQVLFNLLSNASKFTQSGKITLEVRAQNRQDKPWVAFSVRDTGIGISKEDLPNLFREFFQVDDSATRKFSGTGLGLAISRRFCQMMDGDITVESQVGHGSTFTAWFPIKTQDDLGLYSPAKRTE